MANKFPIILLILFSIPYNFLNAQDAGGLRRKPAEPAKIPAQKIPGRLGFGIGIPYGIEGINLQVDIMERITLSYGMGTTGSDMAQSLGGRVYPGQTDRRGRLYFSFNYGIIGLAEITSIVSSFAYGPVITETKTEKLFGAAVGPGYSYRSGRFSWDVEVLFLAYDLPENVTVTKDNGNIKYSFGIGWYF